MMILVTPISVQENPPDDEHEHKRPTAPGARCSSSVRHGELFLQQAGRCHHAAPQGRALVASCMPCSHGWQISQFTLRRTPPGRVLKFRTAPAEAMLRLHIAFTASQRSWAEYFLVPPFQAMHAYAVKIASLPRTNT